MHRLALLALALVAAAPLSGYAVPSTYPAGPGCASASFPDPTGQPGTRTGFLAGGPVLLLVGPGTLVCRIQVNDDTYNPSGSGPTISAHAVLVASVGPVEVTFVADTTDRVYVCTEVRGDDGVTYYYNDTLTWSTVQGRCPQTVT